MEPEDLLRVVTIACEQLELEASAKGYPAIEVCIGFVGLGTRKPAHYV